MPGGRARKGNALFSRREAGDPASRVRFLSCSQKHKRKSHVASWLTENINCDASAHLFNFHPLASLFYDETNNDSDDESGGGGGG